LGIEPCSRPLQRATSDRKTPGKGDLTAAMDSGARRVNLIRIRSCLNTATLILCCALALPTQAGPESESESESESANNTLIKNSLSVELAASSLLTELYLTENALIFSHNDLVMLMFSQSPETKLFLHYAELYIDDERVDTYIYPRPTLELLSQQRAVQPLFSTLLPPGEHRLRVRIYGLALGGNHYLEAEQIIYKTDQPLFLQFNNDLLRIDVTPW
jgi:hypothetical protein